MSISRVTKSIYVRAPIDGLNLISPPTEFLPTEARQLDNYFIYDWGIRERGALTRFQTPDAARVVKMIGYTPSGGTQRFVIATSNNVYRYTNAGVFTQLDTTMTALGSLCGYKGHIYAMSHFPAGTDATGRYLLSSETWTEPSFTLFSGATGYNSAFTYKNRIYFIGQYATSPDCTTIYSSSTVGAITGAVDKSFDTSLVLERGGNLVFGTSWSYNQGLNNDELMVLLADTGEVLIYTGDYPEASNFQLLTRVTIPAPFLDAVGNAAVLKIGQDVYISTLRGVISLAQVIAGRTEDTAYYNLSRKIGPVLSYGHIDKSSCYPFAYFPAGEDVYVLNYERGSWSRLKGIAPTGGQVTGCACSTTSATNTIAGSATNPTSYVLFSYQDVSNNYYIARLQEDASVADPSITYTYKTAFFDFGSSNQKNLKLIRTLGRDINSNSFNNTVVSSNSFDDSTAGTAVSKTTTVSSQKYVLQELAPGGTGQWLSLNYSKSGSSSAMNEISGTSIFYEEGGAY